MEKAFWTHQNRHQQLEFIKKEVQDFTIQIDQYKKNFLAAKKLISQPQSIDFVLDTVFKKNEISYSMADLQKRNETM